jgi:nucleotide-binding universal stress UspA family protein
MQSEERKLKPNIERALHGQLTKGMPSEISVSLPRRILVAVEGSEPSLRESSLKAARYALILASTVHSELLGVCVVQIPEYIEENTRAILRDELFKKSDKTLGEIKDLANEYKVGFEARTLETSGSIATTICNLSEKEGVDLIVLGTRASTSPLAKMMLGSVASGVVSNAGCPVLVVR